MFINLKLQKCYVRFKEARQNSFESGRNVDKIDLISKVIREFGELEDDINLQEEILKELVDNVDAWMVKELEKEENYLIHSEENVDVLCPICQKNKLHISREHLYICSCGQKISFNGDLKELQLKINKSVVEHESKLCGEMLTFFVEPKDNSYILSFFCASCDFYGLLK